MLYKSVKVRFYKTSLQPQWRNISKMYCQFKGTENRLKKPEKYTESLLSSMTSADEGRPPSNDLKNDRTLSPSSKEVEVLK